MKESSQKGWSLVKYSNRAVSMSGLIKTLIAFQFMFCPSGAENGETGNTIIGRKVQGKRILYGVGSLVKVKGEVRQFLNGSKLLSVLNWTQFR